MSSCNHLLFVLGVWVGVAGDESFWRFWGEEGGFTHTPRLQCAATLGLAKMIYPDEKHAV